MDPYWAGDLLRDAVDATRKHPVAAMLLAPVGVSVVYQACFQAYGAVTRMPWFSFYAVGGVARAAAKLVTLLCMCVHVHVFACICMCVEMYLYLYVYM